MKSFVYSALAGAAMAQETVTIFGGLPSVSVNQPDPVAVEEWAMEVDEAGRAIDAKVATAWETYVAAVQEPVAQLMTELESASNEYDKLTAQSLADILRYTGDNTFLDNGPSLSEAVPAINVWADQLSAYDPTAAQPLVLMPVAAYNYYTWESEVGDPCSPDFDPCAYDYACAVEGAEVTKDYSNWTCVDPNYTDFLEESFYNQKTYQFEFIDPRDPRYDPCDFSFECSYFDEPVPEDSGLPMKVYDDGEAEEAEEPSQLGRIGDFLRQKAQPYLDIKAAYDEQVLAQAQADLEDAKAAIIAEIERNLEAAKASTEGDDEMFEEAGVMLKAQISMLAQQSQMQINAAQQSMVARNEATLGHFNAFARRFNVMAKAPPAPIRMQEEAWIVEDEAAVYYEEDEQSGGLRDQLLDALEDKAEVYEELDRQFKEELQAQFAADMAEAQQQLAGKLNELADALEDAAEQLAGEVPAEAVVLAKKEKKEKKIHKKAKDSGYSAAMYGAGAVGLAAVLGYAGYAATRRSNKVEGRAAEPLLAEKIL